ncbi:MAG: ornithine carbamoyltransferase [Candidatus Korobacteraceae bacterium]|jgi:ornithine carbamoyltransferase
MATRPTEDSVVSPELQGQFQSHPADLVSVTDFKPGEAKSLLELTAALKSRPQDFRGALAGKQLVLFFEKPSLRTRLTFEAGINSLGGSSIFVDQTHSRLGQREPLHDVAHNVERWVDGLVLRTFYHSTVTDMAAYASIPVINALSDHEHPCQAFADFFTLQEKFGNLAKVKLAYVGDGNNVAHSLMLAAATLGSHIALATPAEYAPEAQVVAKAREIASHTGATLELTTDPQLAVAGAKAVYTDVWTSMGQEAETEFRRKIFSPYQVNRKLMSLAAPDAVFMHCLPAHRGDEVTANVIDSSASVVFDQAENRLHIQKAILMVLLGKGMRRFGPRSAHA